MTDTDTTSTTATRQHILPEDIHALPEGASVLDLLEIPDDITDMSVLIGKDNPVTGDDAMFVLFGESDERVLQRNMKWCYSADIVVDLISMMPDGIDDLAREVHRRWPDAKVYDYGCLCCGGYPERYRF